MNFKPHFECSLPDIWGTWTHFGKRTNVIDFVCFSRTNLVHSVWLGWLLAGLGLLSQFDFRYIY